MIVKLLNKVIDILKKMKIIKTKNISDGYHTFDELYHHRAILFSVIVNEHKDISWKSMYHHDGTMFDDMFIVGIDTPEGQYSYHYNVFPYWDLFDCKMLDKAPVWDGHKPCDIKRLKSLYDSKEFICYCADNYELQKSSCIFEVNDSELEFRYNDFESLEEYIKKRISNNLFEHTKKAIEYQCVRNIREHKHEIKGVIYLAIKK